MIPSEFTDQKFYFRNFIVKKRQIIKVRNPSYYENSKVFQSYFSEYFPKITFRITRYSLHKISLLNLEVFSFKRVHCDLSRSYFFIRSSSSVAADTWGATVPLPVFLKSLANLFYIVRLCHFLSFSLPFFVIFLSIFD